MILNPYNIEGNWYKGNLHTHTKNSTCGHYTVDKVIDIYTSYQMEYDFLAITDHYFFTRLDQYIDDNRIILFSGVEYKKVNYQMLGLNISRYNDDFIDSDSNIQDIFDDVNNQRGMSIICHPHIYKDDYWPWQKLLELTGYKGVEIFNNNVKVNNAGRAVATDVWDFLLSNDKKVYGFANDDMHVFHRAGAAFNMVLAKERSRECIVDGLENGRFYATTGILLKSLNVLDNLIHVETQLPVIFKFIGKGPKLLKEQIGLKADYKCRDDEGYVRIEMAREDGAMAWTQPFYIV